MTTEEAIEILSDVGDINRCCAEDAEALDMAIKALEQQPKTGQWIDGKCNRCGTHAPFWMMASTYHCSNYCPNCGAKMQEVEE